MKDIRNYNNKGQFLGYQEWYDGDTLGARVFFKHGKVIGYWESHSHKQTSFTII